MPVRVTANIGFLLCLLSCKLSYGQLKYSIDIKPEKNRHIEIGYQITTIKQTVKTNSEIRKKHREERKVSRQTRKHIYSIQTSEVKKRMRKAHKKADRFNDERGWFYKTIKKLF